MASSRLPWASRAASYLRISVFHRGYATVLKDLKYFELHDWVKVEGSSATFGITDHAQDHLGDVLYVELPEVGTSVKQGKNFGAVESVKATSDIYSPVSGEVAEVNTELNNSPGLRMDGYIVYVESRKPKRRYLRDLSQIHDVYFLVYSFQSESRSINIRSSSLGLMNPKLTQLAMMAYITNLAVLKDLKYFELHDWVKVEGSSAIFGMTDHAQDHLGDVLYVELPEVGTSVK